MRARRLYRTRLPGFLFYKKKSVFLQKNLEIWL